MISHQLCHFSSLLCSGPFLYGDGGTEASGGAWTLVCSPVVLSGVPPRLCDNSLLLCQLLLPLSPLCQDLNPLSLCKRLKFSDFFFFFPPPKGLNPTMWRVFLLEEGEKKSPRAEKYADSAALWRSVGEQPAHSSESRWGPKGFYLWSRTLFL